MAYPKKLNAANKSNQERAIEAHAGFVSYVVGRVKKIGIETILQQYQPALGPPTEFHWLKKAYDKVLKFAEEVQLKQMPTKLSGDDENPLRIEVYLPQNNGKTAFHMKQGNGNGNGDGHKMDAAPWPAGVLPSSSRL